ncbi:hypothetical protein OAK92_02245 [Crocinitomicaceae bacterium]|nr:hypothetical protein [Crocinitomicaceae bacterium]
MSKSKNAKTSNKILEVFRGYWDKWHEEWCKQCALVEEPKITKIHGWSLSKEKITYHLKGTKIPIKLPIHLAIPEPYWISKKIIEEDIKPRAVFFNINPGPNKFYHLLNPQFYTDKVNNETDRRKESIKKLIKALKTSKSKGEIKKLEKEKKKLEKELKELSHPACNQDNDWVCDSDNSKGSHNWSNVYNNSSSYSEFIDKLIEIYKDENKFWHFERRLKWVQEFEASKGNTSKKKCELNELATFEYFPFHTNEASTIKSIWINEEDHNEHLLNPAVHLSRKVQITELKNKIISRGNWNKSWKHYFEEIANDWEIFPKKIVVYPRFNKKPPGSKGSTPYTLNICYTVKQEEKPVYFLNFDGGGPKGMYLPTLEIEQTVCFIEIYGDKYISVYFDEFMREIDKYIPLIKP